MPVIELKIPNLGESISSVTFSKWLEPDGATVSMDEPLCEIETEKANQELSADSAGKLTWVAKEGEDLAVGALFAKIDTDAAGSTAATPAATAPAVAPPTPETTNTSTNYATGFPSPAAAKILEEGQVSGDQVKGSGRDGRITKEDAQKAVENKPAPTPTPAASSTTPPAPLAPPSASRNW